MAYRDVGGMQVVIDPAEWYRLKQELDKFDPELARQLRRRIKHAGDKAAQAVRAKLAEPSPDGGPDPGYGRAAIAAATKVTVSFAKRAAGTRIVSSASRLPPQHKGLLNVYNKETFRHPVFGNRNEWVEQKGRPYFGAVITKMITRETLIEIRAALDYATQQIGATGR